MKSIFKRIAATALVGAVMAGVFAFAGCTPGGTPEDDKKPAEDQTTQYTVTYNLNYSGAPAATTEKVDDGKAATKPANPTRSGFTFDNWYTEAECVNIYDFEEKITADKTLYAGWLEEGVTYYTVTYHYNYEGATEDFSQKVKENDYATQPKTPEREGYDFFGWYQQAECTSVFRFFTQITADTDIYASWNKLYVFEAENVDFDELDGPGYSGSATGSDMILKDRNGNANVSGGYYVSYLYRNGTTLEFHIKSSAAVTNAHFYASLSAESQDITITSSTYQFRVNGGSLAYDDIKFTEVPSATSGIVKSFQTFLISTTVSLKEGDNVITLVTDNNIPMGGTMKATAPMVDCIKIASPSVLSWNEELGFPFINK